MIVSQLRVPICALTRLEGLWYIAALLFYSSSVLLPLRRAPDVRSTMLLLSWWILESRLDNGTLVEKAACPGNVSHGLMKTCVLILDGFLWNLFSVLWIACTQLNLIVSIRCRFCMIDCWFSFLNVATVSLFGVHYAFKSLSQPIEAALCLLAWIYQGLNRNFSWNSSCLGEKNISAVCR